MKTLPTLLSASFFFLAILHQATAFSLLGPLQNQANGAADPWQGRPYAGRVGGLGYSQLGDIGGPMHLDESYRWNVPSLTYGFDPEFVDEFGQAGVDEVEKAIAILNALPPASAMSAALEEFPTDTKAQNGTAELYNLLDLKSHALSLLLEQLGLAMPERFVWSLRARNSTPEGTNYTVMKLNYDPITWQASHYVNGVLYSYRVWDNLGPRGEEWASAVESYQLDPNFLPYSSVAAGLGSRDYQSGSEPSGFGAPTGLRAGQFFTGLTRDDVGGLRFLLSRGNKRWETLLPHVTSAGSNAASFVNLALRPGVEKLTFKRQQFDPATQQFQPVANIFLDTYFTNDVAVTQTLKRVVTIPDILFRARALGGTIGQLYSDTVFIPRHYDRSDTSTWKNHAGFNSRTGAGPGVIQPPVQITFNKLGRYAIAGGSQFTPLWASFDGSEIPPVWFPGNETNISSLVVQSRMVRTNDTFQFEWTTLRLRNRSYRVEVSTNLVNWTLFSQIEPSPADLGNAFTLRSPVGKPPQFFRAIQESQAP